MGKLKSFIKLEGTLDGLTFYKSQDGYMVRTKGGVSKNRIMKDPAFKRTRENLSEFALNAKSGKFMKLRKGSVAQGYPPYLRTAKLGKLKSNKQDVRSTVRQITLANLRKTFQAQGFGPKGGVGRPGSDAPSQAGI